jgi:fatty acid desaturase
MGTEKGSIANGLSIIEASNEDITSKLREHIQEEELRPAAKLFLRSTPATLGYVLTPFLFLSAVILLARYGSFPFWILILVSLPLLLAAQRCFQTLVHDLSHKLFSIDIARNNLWGNYLVAGWTGASVPAYRAIHLQHHKYNGSTLDPEHISFETITSKGGLLRHCLRYVVAMEALRLIMKYYGRKEDTSTATQSKSLKFSKIHIVVCQLALAGIFLYIAGTWYLYLIWLYLAVTWNPLFSNLRFLVEHPGESDLTVSTPSNWLERLYFAPFNFNFHLEHHLWPNLPPYQLANAHRYLIEQGYFQRHPEFLGSGFIHSLRNR